MVPMRAAVEAMGAVVDYDAATRTASVKMGDVSFTHVIGTDVITLSDGSTVKMDIVSYIDKGRTMVPLRFFSQVLGYDVFWDNDYKLAFLMGEDTWAAAVDKDLTILNSLLAQQSKSADLSKTQKSTLTAKGAVKVVDSINGDKSYPYSGSMTVLAGKDAANLTMSLDLSSMLELLESLVEDSTPAEYRAQLAKFSAEAILSDKAYIKSPLLDAMSESKSGTWYALGELNYSELYQQAISAASASASATTFGHLLYAMMQQGDANHFFASWEGCTAAAQLIKLMYADSTFVKSGSGYQWHFGLAELAKLMNSMDSETNYTADSLKKDGLTDDDIGKLQLYCSALEPTRANLRLRAIIALFLFQGLRQIEVVRLDVTDINLRDKVALIRGKGRDDKEPVYLHPSTVKVLREYLRLYHFREGALFRSDSNHCRGERLTTKSIREIIKRTFHTLQIDGSAHGFRHYFITKLIKSYKGELLTASKYSRHRSIQMLEVYNDEIIRQEDLPRYYRVFKDIRI